MPPYGGIFKAMIYGYADTYASAQAPGTYRFTLDDETGALSHTALVYAQRNTKYAAFSGRYLATLTERDGRAGVALLQNDVLLVSNRSSNALVSFRLENGQITQPLSHLTIPKCVGLTLTTNPSLEA